MAAIDEKITEVMREMARRRWAKTTAQERRDYAKFLVSTRKKSRVNGSKKEEPEPPGVTSCDDPGETNDSPPCFRCQSGYHDRCLDNGVGGFLRCYCRRVLNHSPE